MANFQVNVVFIVEAESEEEATSVVDDLLLAGTKDGTISDVEEV